MSAIELDALDAFIEASDQIYGMSLKDTIGMIRRLDEAGWQLTRKPEPEQLQAATPIAEAALNSTAWPPSGITEKLWATDMYPDGDKWIQVESVFELFRMTERGASLVEATTLSDAQSFWKSGQRPDSEFIVGGVKYQYTANQVPF
jgi:hypothetical protein